MCTFWGAILSLESVVALLLIDARVAGAAKASATVSPHLGSLPAASYLHQSALWLLIPTLLHFRAPNGHRRGFKGFG